MFLIVWTAINNWHYISLYHYNAFACILQEGWLTFLLKKYSLLNIHTWFDRGVLSAWSQVRCHIGLKTTAYDSHHFHPHEAFLWLPTPTPSAWPLSLWKNPFSTALKCFFVDKNSSLYSFAVIYPLSGSRQIPINCVSSNTKWKPCKK